MAGICDMQEVIEFIESLEKVVSPEPKSSVYEKCNIPLDNSEILTDTACEDANIKIEVDFEKIMGIVNNVGTAWKSLNDKE